MKYSIIMPYYKRTELRFTLDTFVEFYKDRDDFEVLIVEDFKNSSNHSMHDAMLKIIDRYKDTIAIRVVVDPKVSYNPSSKYNLGFREAKGDILMITNPEIPHTVDILGAIDKENINNLYIVCSCKSMYLVEDKGNFRDSSFRFHMWYQHTRHRDVRYHFCTVVSKSDYGKIGGFNEVFCAGIAYDDDNFVKRIQRANVIILP